MPLLGVEPDARVMTSESVAPWNSQKQEEEDMDGLSTP